MEIIIRDNSKKLVMKTTPESFVEDIIGNRDLINGLWWDVFVEYIDGTDLYTTNNPRTARRVVVHNGRSILADWNINVGISESRKKTADRLIKLISDDLRDAE